MSAALRVVRNNATRVDLDAAADAVRALLLALRSTNPPGAACTTSSPGHVDPSGATRRRTPSGSRASLPHSIWTGSPRRACSRSATND